jgi:hypothetical protein
MILVVDVFEGNGAVDWARVKGAGVEAAIHKATQYRVDRLFADHHAAIPAAGLHHGCYHFMAPDTAPSLQANLYLNTLGWRPGEFGWVIDYERANGVLPGVAWLSTLLNALPPGPVLLYGNRWDLATLGPTFNGRVKVWVADYGVNDGTPHGDPATVRASTQFPAADVVLWQFTSRGRVDGISGYVDVSMWLGTDAEWAAYMGESQPVVQPQPIHYEGDNVTKLSVHVPTLDDQGNGNIPIAGMANRVVSVNLNGNDPNHEGYAGLKPFFSHSARGADELLVIEGGKPHTGFDLNVWVTG